MDTRSKILTPGASLPPEIRRPLVVVTGYFDVLRGEHVRELASVRERIGAGTLVVAVLPLAEEVLEQRARAELVAALRMVDYVLIADPQELERLIASFEPAELVRLEAGDARRIRELKEHVHRTQP